MYEVTGTQGKLPMETRFLRGPPRIRLSKACSCSRENVKNLQNIQQLYSALQTQIFVLYQETAQGTGTISLSA